jgi:hypothetical protein
MYLAYPQNIEWAVLREGDLLEQPSFNRIRQDTDLRFVGRYFPQGSETFLVERTAKKHTACTFK